jgi:hypothetical protein
MTLDELAAQRDALLAARYRGVRTVEIDGRRVTYATDSEMAAAIADLERRIALVGADGRRRRTSATLLREGDDAIIPVQTCVAENFLFKSAIAEHFSLVA